MQCVDKLFEGKSLEILLFSFEPIALMIFYEVGVDVCLHMKQNRKKKFMVFHDPNKNASKPNLFHFFQFQWCFESSNFHILTFLKIFFYKYKSLQKSCMWTMKSTIYMYNILIIYLYRNILFTAPNFEYQCWFDWKDINVIHAFKAHSTLDTGHNMNHDKIWAVFSL